MNLTAVSKFEAILNNAIRLLDDARILRKSRRYNSAAALAILSLEEIAKFVLSNPILANEVSVPNRKSDRPHSHRQKQKAAGEILIGILGVNEVDGLLNTLGYELAIIPKHNQKISSKEQTIAEALASIDDEHYKKKIAGKFKKSKHHQFIIQLLRGDFEGLKHKCLYVDLDAQGQVIANAENSIDRKTADKVISMAGTAIYVTRTMILRASKRLRSVNRKKK